MDLFEEANRDICRAYDLGEYDKALELARDVFKEAQAIGMEDLCALLQECIERGRIGRMHTILQAMRVRSEQIDLDKHEVALVDLRGSQPSPFTMPSMN